jgi:exodeoxyribonuclease VII small subunit
MPARTKSATSSPDPSLSFEDSLSKLEEIVESMESEQLPLEDLVAHYEAGSVLLKHCDKVLSAARKRIELITLANRDEIGLDAGGDLTHGPDTASDSTTEVPDDDNDISLF